MFNSINTANEIKNSYIDYITTTFNISDKDYAEQFKNELEKDGMVSKGPYLDIGGSFVSGHSLNELIAEGKVNKGFLNLEPIDEKDREIKLERPLYLHQEKAMLKAIDGKSLVITTGTGSGKTECFLLPIINHLLLEKEQCKLSSGVRAVIIYPMNALANDQIKRMRKILKNYPSITFGVYNGNTKHSNDDGIREYKKLYGCEPSENECISREEMQENPPHILITNYSMLEYLMLRPKDEKIFTKTQLKYIILDEAHIYKGATGMETSMLMRRLRARISKPDCVQYILTSATLGEEEANKDILNFAKKLCGVSLTEDCIIRSKMQKPKMIENRDFPVELFEELYDNENNENKIEILKKYNADFDLLSKDISEKLYELCLRSKLFDALREYAKEPVIVKDLQNKLSEIIPITSDQFIKIIEVFGQAEKDGAKLIKPRYHYFVRCIEGAYIKPNTPKKLMLDRKEYIENENGEKEKVFEIAVCQGCGHIAIVGVVDRNNIVYQSNGKGDDKNIQYFYIKDKEENNDVWFDESDGENDYVICGTCGKKGTKADNEIEKMCKCDPANYIQVRTIDKKNNEKDLCPGCGLSNFRRFYLGNEAATAVLGTELYEQLPYEKVEIIEPSKSDKNNIFSVAIKYKKRSTELARQFLCFSDSRSEASFFAVYMERSYQDFLRRRGMYNVIKNLKESDKSKITVSTFISELKNYFKENYSFVDYDVKYKSKSDIETLNDELSEKNAWIAVLNEMFNARRKTSLVSLGIISFEYFKNSEDVYIEVVQNISDLSKSEAKDFLNLLVQDGVYFGAIDAGKKFKIGDDVREYIFYSKAIKKIQLKKDDKNNINKSYIANWCATARNENSYYLNSRLVRTMNALNCSQKEANEFLENYYSGVLEGDKYFSFDANDFTINLDSKFYRCKKCGRVTSFNVKNKCTSIKCNGELEEFNHETVENNHYMKLYSGKQMKPLYIKEHTAQLSRDKQTEYQNAFINKKINALSCSTTFEMGVDLGSLETVYMRDVPPSPANYVQRAGRAGRGKNSSAFVLTYAKLSSHDFTYYKDPIKMISGKISAPVFEIENKKIIYRHIFAVALSNFFSEYPEIYDGDNASVFLNEGGYEKFKEFLNERSESLKEILKRSIPENMHDAMGIENFDWVDYLCGKDGVLELSVYEYKQKVEELEKLCEVYNKNRILETDSKKIRELNEIYNRLSKRLSNLKCSKEDNSGKRSLVDFLVRNNILPKYGFPVDTVELITNTKEMFEDKELQLSRDLQMAIAEYAPGSEVVADGDLYTSRYIRKQYGSNGSLDWEKGEYCESCPNCGELNFTKDYVGENGRECISCHNNIPKNNWKPTLEPRRGFIAALDRKPVPMHRPERDFKTNDYYIGDKQRNLISKLSFKVRGKTVDVESTTNDSLVVIGQTKYYVCPMCGYSSDEKITEHQNYNGFDCEYTSENDKINGSKVYKLSHDFKTDVAKITFYDNRISGCSKITDNKSTMLSVLYAILEGLSQELEIERTDIKGCLFRNNTDMGYLYSIILYDAVAGGAGHVRRIVTEDGQNFQRVLKRALSIVKNCDCGLSCYNCLRNYYNQKIHDKLSRKEAEMFIEEWIGSMELIYNTKEK